MANEPLVLVDVEDDLEDGVPKINQGIQNAYKASEKVSTSIGQLNINRGADFPLSNTVRDGVLPTFGQVAKDAIISVEVSGAKQGKIYGIEWLGNGYDDAGTIRYGFTIAEYDKATFGTNSESGRRQIAYYKTNNFPAPDPNAVTVTRNLYIPAEDITFTITYDRTKIGTILRITENTTGVAKGAVIDERCYTYKQKVDENKGNLLNNQGKVYPFENVVRAGTTYPEIQEVNNAILDCTVQNAKLGKIYRISYIANGTTAWGNPNYSIWLEECDPDFQNLRTVFSRANQNTSAPTKAIETRTISANSEDIILKITIDYSKLTKDKYLLNVAGDGFGYIISANKYLSKKAALVPTIDTLKKNEVAVVKSGTTISAKFYYSSTKDMIIEWSPLKNNSFTHFSKWYFQDKGRAWNDFTGAQAMTTGTDWVSPYGLMAENNPVSSKSFTVGGAHGTEGTTGFPTGRNQSTKVLVDGVEVTDGVSMNGNEVTIIAEHYVFASNVIDTSNGNARDVLRELVTYTVTPNNIQISTELKALEDCKITRYAGLQATKTAGYWSKFYAMLDKVAVYNTTDTTEGATEPKSKVNTDRFILYGGVDTVVCYMNRFGIGDKRYVADTDSYVYWTGGEFGKLYMHNIKQEVPLKAGESLFYSGGYTLMETFKNTLRGYFIKEGNQKVYVLDFHGTNNVIVDIGEYNKKVKVIDKTANITCDDYVTGVGLRVNSVGYNQLKFILE
ncbi:hypothetical protein EXW38_11550 [Bacillus mycoides]|uniref:hypothetical protein n=1 Tax=Bacillus mycoides TaxID=1405 RepID=UPI001C035EFA|nr:hypothetical protein [Bacillus mycoides]QWH11960.1 hypothetical protein EXW38_11550 [Bacillus mycoides]